MEDITRRNFVAGGAAAGAALAAAGVAGTTAAPARFARADEAKQHAPISTEEFDVVVVGSGTAGTCATLRAAQDGAKVVCLEKNDVFGGASRFAEGLAGVGSKVQAELGIDLNKTEIMDAVMDYQHYSCSGPVVRKFLDESGPTIDWLTDAGIAWLDVKVLGRSYQTWHIPANPTTGEKIVCGGIIDQLVEVAQGLGADMRLGWAMTDLIVEDGKVVGVYADGPDGEVEFRVKGVILAGGGYANNGELFEKFTGVDYDKVYVYGPAGRDGEGIASALAIGGSTHKPGCVMFHSGKLEDTTSFSDLPNFIVCKQPTVRVNAGGTRYFNEQVSMTDFSACGNVLTTNAQNFAVFDDDFITHIEEEGPWLGLLALNAEAGVPFECREEIEAFAPIKKADTIEELAEALGIDAAQLAATVERYNGFVEAGVDEDFGLPEQYLFPVKTPPFYGALIMPTLFTTVGGLAVDERMRVLDTDGYAIEGLYATGGDAGSFYGASYDVGVCAGSQQGWAAMSGRLAAEDIVGA